ncbi:putative Late nodulin [Medicago truncatula]|uniref:Putative Late nodulin n=1 Tax=Medicago truncatula TaxID=3880 RepID=A0A396JLB6_MEDTR|nr:putative Late nodulin [Medicago truncatula]
MTQISISFYALIIFFSLFLVVTNGRNKTCNYSSECLFHNCPLGWVMKCFTYFCACSRL